MCRGDGLPLHRVWRNIFGAKHISVRTVGQSRDPTLIDLEIEPFQTACREWQDKEMKSRADRKSETIPREGSRLHDFERSAETLPLRSDACLSECVSISPESTKSF